MVRVSYVERLLQPDDEAKLHNPLLPGLRVDPQAGEGLVTVIAVLSLPQGIPKRRAVVDFDEDIK